MTGRRGLWSKIKTSKTGIGITDKLFSASEKRRYDCFYKHGRLADRMKTVNQHYEYNSQFKLTGYLNGQGIGDLSKLKYGNKTFKEAGCGPIAVYNALLTLGTHVPIQDITRHFEINGIMAGGRFGTSPFAIDKFFRDRGCSVKTRCGADISSESEYDEIFADYTAAIFSYYHGNSLAKGSHFVAVSHRADGGINAYNYADNSSEAKAFASVSELIHSGKGRIPLSITAIK